MGGRGTFASGNSVPYTYETIEKINGVKVLQGLGGKHNLPEESHSSNAYILTDRAGNFVRFREFNSYHTSKFDIDYHPERKISGHYNPIFHIHEYNNGIRDPLGRTLTDAEYKKYKKFFRGR